MPKDISKKNKSVDSDPEITPVGAQREEGVSGKSPRVTTTPETDTSDPEAAPKEKKKKAPGSKKEERREKKRLKKESESKETPDKKAKAIKTQQKNEIAFPVKKDFYKESEEMAATTEDQITDFYEEHSITVHADQRIKPYTSFEELAYLDKKLIKALENFSKPTPIQSISWPVLLKGQDFIGIAATGSGKTLSFVIPAAIHALTRDRTFKASKSISTHSFTGPYAVVLTPTRELAIQIGSVFTDIGHKCRLQNFILYGGVSKYHQLEALKRNMHVITATPGRFLDFLYQGQLKTNNVTFVVLDEADRMLDMGFEPDVRNILSKTHSQRQTVMFSATWPSEIQKFAHEFMTSPLKVTIGSKTLSANTKITQLVEVIPTDKKNFRLLDLLFDLLCVKDDFKRDPFFSYKKNATSRGTSLAPATVLNNTDAKDKSKSKVLIFVLYKKEVPYVEQTLKKKNFDVAAVHGDIPQELRTRNINDFKTGKVNILIATDVCARGIDIPDVKYVINYTFPLTIEDYVHRVGRTGRAGKAGAAFTFFTDREKHLAGQLVDVLKSTNQNVPEALTKFGYTPARKKEHSMYGSHYRNTEDDSVAPKEPTKIIFD